MKNTHQIAARITMIIVLVGMGIFIVYTMLTLQEYIHNYFTLEQIQQMTPNFDFQ